MLNGLNIIVIGAGIGGLAVARALALRGARVSVLEQAEAIREVGAGLQISPNGFAVLQALGLGGAVADAAVQAGAVSLRDYRKGEVLRLDLTRGAGAGHATAYHFVHRATLIDILAQGARDAGAGVALSRKVAGVGGGAPASVVMEAGDTLTADLVIGADGLHSCMRPVVCPTDTPFFTGQVAWRAIVPNGANQPDEVRVHMGPHRHVVTYPLKGGRLNIVAVQEQADWAPEGWSVQADADDLRRVFADFGAPVRAVLAQVDKVHLWGLFRHGVAQKWHGEGLALLGDAAHPTLPFLAQGANMALEDAWVLADALAGADTAGQGLVQYQSRRRDRVRRVIAAANGNAWKYHLAFPPLRAAAHMGLRVAGRVAPGAMLRQFDWLYGHDVTQGGKGAG